MGIIRNTINRLREDVQRLNEIKDELSSYLPSGKRDALLKRKVMLERAIQQRVHSLKNIVNLNQRPIEVVILVNLDNTKPKYYRKIFYGLTPEEVKELIDLEMMYVRGEYYTLVKLEPINTSLEWEELLENK